MGLGLGLVRGWLRGWLQRQAPVEAREHLLVRALVWLQAPAQLAVRWMMRLNFVNCLKQLWVRSQWRRHNQELQWRVSMTHFSSIHHSYFSKHRLKKTASY